MHRRKKRKHLKRLEISWESWSAFRKKDGWELRKRLKGREKVKRGTRKWGTGSEKPGRNIPTTGGAWRAGKTAPDQWKTFFRNMIQMNVSGGGGQAKEAKPEGEEQNKPGKNACSCMELTRWEWETDQQIWNYWRRAVQSPPQCCFQPHSTPFLQHKWQQEQRNRDSASEQSGCEGERSESAPLERMELGKKDSSSEKGSV